MLTDEAPQVQEVRYCLKTLREQMAARQTNNNKDLEEKAKDCINLAELKNLYSRLQDNDTLEAQQRELRCLFLEKEQEEKMKAMQMLMDNLRLDNATLQKNCDERCEQLNKQLEAQRHKNSSLEDMVICQQRKLRTIIEQVQNAQTKLNHKIHQISDLKEKVSFLEAENKELHDRLNYLDKREQQTNNPDKDFFSPVKKTLPFMMARNKN